MEYFEIKHSTIVNAHLSNMSESRNKNIGDVANNSFWDPRGKTPLPHAQQILNMMPWRNINNYVIFQM